MPPKTKKKGKKSKKSKQQKNAEIIEEPSEYDNMDLEKLKDVTQILRQQLEKAQLDRNYVQLERDTIQTFYEISKKEIQDAEMTLLAKDREIEVMEENHQVEVRVYVQKVKQLEYEHKKTMQRVANENGSHLDEEKELHDHQEHQLKDVKQSLQLELKERELLNEEEITQVKQSHEKNLTKLREEFERNLEELRERCEQSLRQLREDLELRRKVDLHEVEERKNLHINDLMKNHENAFAQIRNYYNDITYDNLKLIKSLKDEIAQIKKKSAANSKLMQDISQENKRLSEPLKIALQEVEQLKHELKDEEKDRLSLRNAKARLILLEDQLRELKRQHYELTLEYEKVEKERNQLYDNFENTIQTVQRQSEFKNIVLEQRLGNMNQQFCTKETQLREVIAAANLDPHEIEQVNKNLDDVLQSRNNMINDLQYKIARTNKALQDTVRTYHAKFEEFGVPQEDINEMGFTQLYKTTTDTTTTTTSTTGPAGLVAR